jgi:CoA:oxalate CoA-transferase
VASEHRILDDITVIDLSHGVPGAYCTKLLAALGARVIKVEPPVGEAGRAMGPFQGDEPHPEKSGPFLYLNTAKQSVTLNLATAGGRLIFKELAARADTIVESFPPGTLAGWGLGYAELSSLNPRLIVASISPFGQDGPYRDYLANELVAQALGALMYAIGLPEREPVKIGGSPALHNAGGAAFSAIMAALWQRDATGEGQHIDISLHEATALTQIHASVLAAWQGEGMTRRPSTLVEAGDGWVAVGLEMGVAAGIWPRLCAIIGRTDLAEDPRFATSAARRENREALNDVLREWVHGQPKEEVYHQLQSLRSIAGYVATTADLYGSRQLQERGFFQEIDHPATGKVRYPGLPFRVGDAPWVEGPAPLLGEHNDAIYCGELGYSREELVRLREQQVI